MHGTEGDLASCRKILVIDDDPSTSRMVSTWYAGKPFEITHAQDGRTGLSLAGRIGPDLILLDIRMPGVDGLTVARNLKQDPKTRSIPVILLTACRDVNSKMEAFSVGADDYMTKPFELEEVDARIQSLIRRRDFLAELESRVQHLRDENSELERLLVLDEKTGLTNFREFRRRLLAEFVRANRYDMQLSLVLLDVDDFKRINDTYGHQSGDRALAELATLVAGGARQTDVAARYGGEEFAMILPHTGAEMAARVARRIRAAIEDFIFLRDTTPTRLSVSAGVATYPASEGVDSADSLVRAADMAMYEAKNQGKNRVITATMKTDPTAAGKSAQNYRGSGSRGGTRKVSPPGPGSSLLSR
jgi:diguanylate cyclase (GGDEF)-like protein